MNNLSSIHHKNFDRLYDLTQNYDKAVFLDKCLFWWQISKYTLEDDRIWFTRTIAAMAKESKISERSISRYLQEFTKSGYIEKVSKLCVKKHLYIRITDKLIQLIKSDVTYSNKPCSSQSQLPKSGSTPQSVFLSQDGVIEKDNVASSIYKDKDINSSVNNTTVSISLFVDKKQQPTSTQFPDYAIEEHIGERMTPREKNYIKGVMNQILRQDKALISNPNQLFAEIVFSVTNEYQFKGITNFNHRMQIISKLIRTRRWNTPKGFYNHSDYGRLFKKDEPKQSATQGIAQASNNNKQEQNNKIKQVKNELHELMSEVSCDTSLLKETQSRQNQGENNLDALLQAINSSLNKKQIQIASLNNTLEILCAELAKEHKPIKIVAPVTSNWELYDALCHKQRLIEQRLNKVTIEYEQALQGSPDDPNIQETTDNYLTCVEDYELINDELFQLGELLNQKQSA
jgi:hypothetical protein